MNNLSSARVLRDGVSVPIVLLALLASLPASAATYTVSSTADSGTGTLRNALVLANSGSDTINFNLTSPATISLTSDELRFSSIVTITGPGASSLTIKGNGNYRVFENDGATVSISGLTITSGGGNSATSNLYPGAGGAIINTSGTMTLTGVTLTGNAAIYGGALANNGTGTVTLTNCTVTSNTATTTTTLSGNGGGVFNYGTLNINGTTISNNSAVAVSTINFASIGGGIYNANAGAGTTGVLNISGSSISGNSGPSEGGGIFNENGTLTITNSTVSGNQSSGRVYSGTTYQGQGGGIENFGSGTISGSTISGNTSSGGSGGLDNQGPMTITNSTFANNSAYYNGGAIEHSGLTYTLAISFTTFYGNVSGTSGFAGQGDGLANFGTAILKNNILAKSTANGGNCYIYPGYPLTSQGYNLSDDASCSSAFTQTGDLNSTPAGLATGLANNGGSTQTIALLSGSPAIDAIPVSSCTDTNGNPVTSDERGTTRPQGLACDMGAFELVEATQSQTITFNALPNEPLGTAPITVSASASSGLTVSFNSQTPTICSVSGANGSTVALGAVGQCTIQATQAGNATYAAATPVNQSFQVTAATLLSQTITFGALPNQSINAAPFTVSATASSSLPVSFNSQTSTTCGVSGNTVTLLALGTCTIQATQGGNATYSAALPVNQSFQITLLTQTITFGALPNLPLTTNPFTLSASASSGLAVSFASATPSVCGVSGTTGALIGAGICTIQATQAGNTTYAAATAVNQSFEVDLIPLFFGTASRVTQQDQFPGDFEDITVGDFGQSSPFVLYSSVSIQAAYPKIVAITAANPAGLSTGAWSDSAQAWGSARGLAFRNFFNQTNSPITLKLNAVLNGQFDPSPFQLPNAPAFAVAAIHVFDGARFFSTVQASGKPAGQFLLDGYSANSALSPSGVLGNLDALFPGATLAPALPVYLTNVSGDPPYISKPFSTAISVPVSSGMFTVQANQEITVVFDAATSSDIVQTGDTLAGGKIGGGDGYFLDTLTPAANFFSDANGNPVTGLVASGGPAAGSLPPTPASLTLAPSTKSSPAGTSATVTATATDTSGNPVANAIISFSVTSGPNAGTQGGGLTGPAGQVAFSYTGTGGTGTDTIQATLGTLLSNVAQQSWTAAPLTTGSGCNGTYNGTFNGNLSVSGGQNCVLVSGKVTGNISLNGGSLTIANTTVQGNVSVQGHSTFSSNANSVIDGNIAIQSVPAGMAQSQLCRSVVKGNVAVQSNGSAVLVGSSAAGCAGNRIAGNVAVQSNAGATAIVGNNISGNVADQSNTGPTQVLDNTLNGSLVCQNNSSITGSGNTASGQKQGQCSAF